jgi:hypothetical protein
VAGPVTIYGSGFGDNPEVNAGWWAMVSVQWANGVEIHGTVSVDPNMPGTWETVTVRVTSRGWGGQGFMPAPGANQTANATVRIRGAALTSVNQSPEILYLSTGDTRSIVTSVTPANTAFSVAYEQIPAGNPHGSCMVGIQTEPASGVGSASSPVHKRADSPWHCSGIYYVRGTAQNSSSTRQSSNDTIVVVPPQQLIQVLYGESHGQVAIGDYVSQLAVGSVIRNRFGDPDHFGGVSTYQEAITPDQFAGIATQITGGVEPELTHAAGIYTETLGTDVAGATCFFSPTYEGWLAIQAALSSGTTELPSVANDPGCYLRPERQFVIKASVGRNAAPQYQGAPAFILVRRRNATAPAVIQIP